MGDSWLPWQHAWEGLVVYDHFMVGGFNLLLQFESHDLFQPITAAEASWAGSLSGSSGEVTPRVTLPLPSLPWQ